ncbi:D-2-hydroxyacid dehydrogenase [Burkholderia sp. WSM2232]|uniref:D-2-hydroxyacid dehydrogenase n=1 Tax=Burkholderia sp. WSM2232 TaxID=944436 RepID=UPI0004886EC1|nr:D-2-hydroxyacid dehydrogenase [Burkholderia sp. WSM2232]
MNGVICFAHKSYQLIEEYKSRGHQGSMLAVRTPEDLESTIGEVEFLCVSGLWQREFLQRAERLRFVQATSSGIEQFDLAAFRKRGIRLCNARGLNANSVAEHGMALMLSATRHLASARDRQRQKLWRPLVSDRSLREREVRGSTAVIVGKGAVGSRLCELVEAFGMHALTVSRTLSKEGVHRIDRTALYAALRRADFVFLTCALTHDTRQLFDDVAFASMAPHAWLVNLARGALVDETALIRALDRGSIAGAALDCFAAEPLAAHSSLWARDNVIITPHTGGETSGFEARFINQFEENLVRLANSQPLINEIVTL